MKNRRPEKQIFFYAHGVVVLFVKLAGVPPKLELFGETFLVKDEFHISLVSVEDLLPDIAKKHKLPLEKAERKAIRAVIEAIDKVDLTFDGFVDDIRLAQKGDRKTIICRCRVKGIESFLARLREDLGVDIQAQPTHVTFYRLPHDKIGIWNREDMDRMTTPLTGEDLQKVKRAIKLI